MSDCVNQPSPWVSERLHVAAAPDAAIRGVVHGLMLALPVWIAGGCVTFILM